MGIFRGHVYFIDDDDVKHHLSEFEVVAENRKEAWDRALDLCWDDRLDSASCRACVEFENED